MKKMSKYLISFLVCAVMFSLCACGGNNGGQTETPDPQTYTIQYTDNTGIHSVEVESGKLFSITSIPEKKGYEFVGLFDAEVGGTQYINAGGSSLAPFSDTKSVVLYPQFRAKEYTLILDYQGAAVTGTRSMPVAYDSEISDLPLNLTLEHKNFQGWYTEPNRGGKQVADRFGVIPENRKVTEKVFDLSDPDRDIKLYAGFKGEEYTVTFYFTESGAPEEMKVEYDTPISQVQVETRVDGMGVLVWSKKRNDTNKEQVFNGKVMGDMVLYAAEYAPVIDFDSNGGNDVNYIVARAGENITLPATTRANYKFMGWQTASGEVVDYKIMPSESVRLTAKWQAMIVFDTNGGTEVENVSEPQGTSITLPETEKDGYMFAGWYDGNGNKYESTAMPSVGVKLYAKYWKINKRTVNIFSSTVGGTSINTDARMDKNCYELDLSDIYNSGIKTIKVTAKYQSRYIHTGTWSNTDAQYGWCYMRWYTTNIASDAYKVWTYYDINDRATEWHSCTHKEELKLSGQKFYICLHGSWSSSNQEYLWKDFYVEIEYPDTTALY